MVFLIILGFILIFSAVVFKVIQYEMDSRVRNGIEFEKRTVKKNRKKQVRTNNEGMAELGKVVTEMIKRKNV